MKTFASGTRSTSGKMWDCGMGANSGLYGGRQCGFQCGYLAETQNPEEAARQLETTVDDLYIEGRIVRSRSKKVQELSLKQLANDAIWKGTEASRSLAVLESLPSNGES